MALTSPNRDRIVRSAGTLTQSLVPIGKIVFNPETGYYGFTVHFEGQRVHHQIDTFHPIESAKRWADPWDKRIWEEPSDDDETSPLISTRKKPGEL